MTEFCVPFGAISFCLFNKSLTTYPLEIYPRLPVPAPPSSGVPSSRSTFSSSNKSHYFPFFWILASSCLYKQIMWRPRNSPESASLYWSLAICNITLPIGLYIRSRSIWNTWCSGDIIYTKNSPPTHLLEVLLSNWTPWCAEILFPRLGHWVILYD